jgi:ankyrin repeat protein
MRIAPRRLLHNLPVVYYLLLAHTCRIAHAQVDGPILLTDEFLQACSQGDVDFVEAQLSDDPSLVHGRSAQGETCLHVAGITGQSLVTQRILDGGGDPNVRTTFAQGLRMHPLSWNVYGGHVDTARVLLEHGASVNLPVDSMKNPTEKVTVLDILLDILSVDQEASKASPDPRLGKYYEMKTLLVKHGAKRFVDLVEDQEL